MKQEKARLAKQIGGKILILWVFSYKKVDTINIHPHVCKHIRRFNSLKCEQESFYFIKFDGDRNANVPPQLDLDFTYGSFETYNNIHETLHNVRNT